MTASHQPWPDLIKAPRNMKDALDKDAQIDPKSQVHGFPCDGTRKSATPLVLLRSLSCGSWHQRLRGSGHFALRQPIVGAHSTSSSVRTCADPCVMCGTRQVRVCADGRCTDVRTPPSDRTRPPPLPVRSNAASMMHRVCQHAQRLFGRTESSRLRRTTRHITRHLVTESLPCHDRHVEARALCAVGSALVATVDFLTRSAHLWHRAPSACVRARAAAVRRDRAVSL
jgi:hypothetical protein